MKENGNKGYFAKTETGKKGKTEAQIKKYIKNFGMILLKEFIINVI